MPSILIFIDWFTPGYKAGGPISSNANLIAHLHHDFEFKVLTRNNDYCESQPYESVTSDAWNTLSSNVKVFYASPKFLGMRNLLKIARKESFDTVYINGIYSWYFSLLPLLYFKYFTRKKILVAARGMLSDHTFSVRRGKKKLFYTLSRYLGLYHGISFHATNEEEAAQIRRNAGFKGTIHIAPNLPPKTVLTASEKIIKTPGTLRLVSIARIAHEKNTLYALEVLSQTARALVDKHADICFDLYGTIYSQEYLRQCQDVVTTLPAFIRVRFMGPLEKHKIAGIFSQYHFLFMPTQGENYGHTIVESMLAATPVIISDRTPWRNLAGNADDTTDSFPASPGTDTSETNTIGWDLPLDSPEAFVKVLCHCVSMDEQVYDGMCSRALAYITQKTGDPDVLAASYKLFL